jgi:hypothetical protein
VTIHELCGVRFFLVQMCRVGIASKPSRSATPLSLGSPESRFGQASFVLSKSQSLPDALIPIPDPLPSCIALLSAVAMCFGILPGFRCFCASLSQPILAASWNDRVRCNTALALARFPVTLRYLFLAWNYLAFCSISEANLGADISQLVTSS